MHAKSAIATALLAAGPMVNAVGTAVISNKCSFPVYLWTVTNEQGAMQTINSGDEYSQGYLTNPDGGGVSMKLATQPTTAGPLTQFEYTLDGSFWYDLSNINGYPFMQWGTTLVPSVNTCRSVLCAAGVSVCSQAYNQPDDNSATAACSEDADTTLVLCSGQDNENTPSQLALNVHNKHHHKHHDKHHDHHHHHHHKHHHKDSVDVGANVPAPAATPAPAPAAAAGPMTTFVTQVVTVTARDAEPSLAARHMHQHHHHHHA